MKLAEPTIEGPMFVAVMADCRLWCWNGDRMRVVWNWKFFLLALAANEASSVCSKVAKVYRENHAYLHLPPWALREPIQLIFYLTHFPLSWFNLILLVLGFFWLPWLTVLVVFGCAFLFGSLVLDALVIGRFPLILQLILADLLFLVATLIFLWR